MITCLGTTLHAQTPDSWVQKSDLGFNSIVEPDGRNRSSSFAVGGKGYIACGYGNNAYNTQLWEYDPTTDSWTQKASFPGAARADAVAFSIGSKGYLGTGYSGSAYYNDFWEYDPTANAWTQKANFAGSVRGSAVGFSLGSKGYIGTGYGTSGYSKDFWEFDPSTNAWTQKTSFGGVARYKAVGFNIGTKGYIGTGTDGNNYYNDFWEYDPSSNAWTQKMSLSPGGRSAAFAFSTSSKGYVGNGGNGTNNYVDFWEYDPATNNWASKTGITNRNAGMAFSISGVGYAAGGAVGNEVTTLHAYNPTNNTWTAKANMGGADGRFVTVGFNIGNKGYIGTGWGSNGIFNDFWEYDPTTNAWAQKANVPPAPREGAVGFGIGVKGYICAGRSSGYLNDLWEYNPVANTWTQKASIPGARECPFAFVVNGKAYVGGGYTGSSTYTNTFYEYNPATNTWTAKANIGGGARALAVGFAIGNKGYMGTGEMVSKKQDFWEYDPAINTWTQKTNFGGGARNYAVGFSLGNKGYLVGGGNGLSYTKDTWEYDPSLNTWTKKADAGPVTRGGGTAFTIGNKAYIGLGLSSGIPSRPNDIWEYTPSMLIQVGTISGSPFCVGASVTVPYTVLGTYTSGNTFTAQLSDASGSFASPVNIGNTTSTTGGSINATIPSGTSSGTGYRIRVISSTPQVVGAENDVNLTINAVVTPSVSISASPGNTICAGAQVSFTATPVNGGTPAYQWKVNNSNVGTNSNTFQSSTLANNDVVVCVMTSNAACAQPASATSTSVTMTVNPIPIPSVSVSANPGNTICAGTLTTFTATPTNGGSTPAYQWKVNNVNAGTNSNIFSSSSLSNSDVVVCELTSNATCASPATVSSTGITMTVNPNLTPSVSIGASPSTTICAGTAVTFTATPTNGGSTPAYQWKVNNVNTGTNSDVFTTTTLNNNDVVTCVLTSNSTCAVPTTASSNSIAITVNANLTPVVSIAASPGSTICAGTAVAFTATPVNGGSTPAYQWKVNSINTGTNSNTFTSNTFNNNDIVTCELTSNATCLATSTGISAPVTMTVNPVLKPSATITANPGVNAGPFTPITFTATVMNGGGAPIYQWKKNGANIAGATSNTYTAVMGKDLVSNDIISMALKSNATCTNPTDTISNQLTITVNLGIADLLENSEPVVIPNPNQGSFVLLLPGGAYNKRITITDPVGRVVLNTRADRVKMQIELSNVTPGVYIIYVEGDEGSYRSKFSVR
jgi:N-acetylneuraminic acid mutarotase